MCHTFVIWLFLYGTACKPPPPLARYIGVCVCAWNGNVAGRGYRVQAECSQRSTTEGIVRYIVLKALAVLCTGAKRRLQPFHPKWRTVRSGRRKIIGGSHPVWALVVFCGSHECGTFVLFSVINLHVTNIRLLRWLWTHPAVWTQNISVSPTSKAARWQRSTNMRWLCGWQLFQETTSQSVEKFQFSAYFKSPTLKLLRFAGCYFLSHSHLYGFGFFRNWKTWRSGMNAWISKVCNVVVVIGWSQWITVWFLDLTWE